MDRREQIDKVLLDIYSMERMISPAAHSGITPDLAKPSVYHNPPIPFSRPPCAVAWSNLFQPITRVNDFTFSMLLRRLLLSFQEFAHEIPREALFEYYRYITEQDINDKKTVNTIIGFLPFLSQIVPEAKNTLIAKFAPFKSSLIKLGLYF